MRRAALGGLIWLGAALAAAPCAHAHEFESEHYAVWSDVSAALAERVAQRMERMHTAYGKLVGVPASGGRFKVRLYASQEACAAYVQQAHGVKGDRFRYVHYGVRSPKNEVVGWHLPDPALFARLRHEAFHQHLRAIVGHPPTWLNEGLAELLEASEITPEGELRVRLSAPMLRRLREGVFKLSPSPLAKKGYERIELRALVRMPKEDWQAKEGSAYCQSWALVHYMLLEDERRWASRLSDYMGGLTRDADGASNLEGAFKAGFAGLDFGQLFSDYSAWVKRTEAPGASDYRAADVAFKARDYDQACELLGRALSADGRNPRYLYLRSEARFSSSKFAEAQEDIVAALQEAPEDELYYLTLGKVLVYRKQWPEAKWALEVARRGGLEASAKRYVAKIPSGTTARALVLTSDSPASAPTPTEAPLREQPSPPPAAPSPPPAAPSRAEPQEVVVGSLVAAKWKNGKWYTAKISAVSAKGYGVHYDDGTRAEDVPAEWLKPLARPGELAPGDRVLAVWKKAQMWGGVIDSVSPEGCVVRWDDGTGTKEIPFGKLCKE